MVAVFLIGSTALPPTNTPVPTETPTPPPTPQISQTPTPSNPFQPVSVVQIIGAFFWVAGLLTTIGKLLIDLKLIKTRIYNFACLFLAVLSLCVIVFGFKDATYFWLGGTLLVAIAASGLLINFVLKTLPIVNPERANIYADYLRLKALTKSLEFQLRKNAGKQKELEGELTLCAGKQEELEGRLLQSAGEKGVLEGRLLQEQANVQIASTEITRLNEEREFLIKRIEVAEKAISYEQYRSELLDHVDINTAIAQMYLYDAGYQEAKKAVKTIISVHVVRKIREIINNILLSQEINEFENSVSLFMVEHRQDHEYGFKVLSAPDLDQTAKKIVEDKFCWDESKKGDKGTYGIASKCAKTQDKDVIYIPYLEHMSNSEKKIFADVVEGERRGALISFAMRIKLYSPDNTIKKIETLGVINVNVPTKKNGTTDATVEEISSMVAEIGKVVTMYSANVCTLIYLYKYVKRLQECQEP